MDLTKLPMFRAMSQRMAWLTQRQQVLAHNVANADTPGFKSRDVKPLNFEQLARDEANRLSVRATRANHVVPAGGATSEFRVEKEKDSAGTVISGNAVVIEEELMKATQTAADYQLTTNLYRKHVGMIRMALGRAGR